MQRSFDVSRLTLRCVLFDTDDHAHDSSSDSETSEKEDTAYLEFAHRWHVKSPDLHSRSVSHMITTEGCVYLTQGSGSNRMHRSKNASITVNAMVASNPKGQFSAMLAREPQFAEKFRLQSKIKPKKKAMINPIVRKMKPSDTFWKLGQVKMRR